MKVEFKFTNGQEVRDKVSGISGIIDCVSMWLNGCKRYSIQPKVDAKDPSKKPESWWVDEQQIEFLSEGISKEVESEPTGGPSFRSDPARA